MKSITLIILKTRDYDDRLPLHGWGIIHWEAFSRICFFGTVTEPI